MVSINFHLQKQDTSQILLMGHSLLSPNLDEYYKEILLKDEARRTGRTHMGDCILIFIKMRNPSQDKEQVGIILYFKNNVETVTKVQIREPENVGLEKISVYFASGSIEKMYVNRPDLLSVTTSSIPPLRPSIYPSMYLYTFVSNFSFFCYSVLCLPCYEDCSVSQPPLCYHALLDYWLTSIGLHVGFCCVPHWSHNPSSSQPTFFGGLITKQTK